MSRKILLAEIPKDLVKLRQKSEVVKNVDADAKKLVAEMFESMKADNGIGLSAPQIGALKRVIIAEYENDHTNSAAHSQAGKKDPLAASPSTAGGHDRGQAVLRTVLINPEIIWISKKEVLDEEGCLSFPNIYGMVKRPEKIRYKALDENGKEIKVKAEGLLARVIQHEIDHLDGILLPDRVEGDLYTYEIRKDSESQAL